MEKKKFSKGKANARPLSERMKTYEAVTTETRLIEKLPIYARIDMRAGHTWCRGLQKPFDQRYVEAMQKATAYVVEKTGAAMGMTQSDEASFVWLDDTKIPFGTRLFKLQSVLASMFTSAFIVEASRNGLSPRIAKTLPSFDCRVMNLPNLEEAANMVMWRSMDSVKNSITLLALEHFSNKQIHGRNGEDKIRMLAEKGVDYYAVPENLRLGSFFRRETYEKTLTQTELAKIPEKQRILDKNGEMKVVRSHIVAFSPKIPLTEIANKSGVLFLSEEPVRKENCNGEQ